MKCRSILTPATDRIRAANSEDYWAYTLRHDGKILEEENPFPGRRKRGRPSRRSPAGTSIVSFDAARLHPL
jgi:hypothetical protein